MGDGCWEAFEIEFTANDLRIDGFPNYVGTLAPKQESMTTCGHKRNVVFTLQIKIGVVFFYEKYVLIMRMNQNICMYF